MKTTTWTTLTFALAMMLWASGCSGGECSTDGDCQAGYRCSNSEGLFFGESICLIEGAGQDNNHGINNAPDVNVAALQFIVEPPSRAVAGESFEVIVRLVDEHGDTAEIDGVLLTLSPDKNTFEPGTTVEARTDANGLAVCSNLTMTTADTGYHLLASSDLLETSSSSFRVVAGSASDANSSIVGEHCVQVDGPLAAEIEINLRDAFDNPLIGVIPTFEASGEGNVYSPCSPTDASGVSICAMLSANLGRQELLLSSPAISARGSVSFARHGLVAATTHAMVLRPNCTAGAWGRDNFGQATLPADLDEVLAVAVGNFHSMALRGDGVLQLWGNNDSGQLVAPEDLTRVAAIAGGGFHSLALQTDGTVVGWGLDNFEQTQAPEGLSDVVAISGGSLHSLALKSNGTVVGWGRDNHGQASPPAGLSTIVAIAAGAEHSLALRADGTVVGWGADNHGQVTPPDGLSDVTAIAAGGSHSLALRADGTVVAWGIEDGSPLDHGQTRVPQGLTDVIAIAAGGTNSLAMRSDGSIVGWGNNTNNQSSGHSSEFQGPDGSLSFVMEPPQSTVAGVPFDIEVRVLDLSSGEAAAAGVLVRLTLNTNQFADDLTTLRATTDADGVATFTSVTITRAAAEYRIIAQSGDLAGESPVFAVTHRDPDPIRSHIGGAECARGDGVDEAIIEVILRDEFGNPVPGLTPTIDVSGEGNVIGACSTGDEQGISRCAVTSDAVERKRVTASEPIGIADAHRFAFVSGQAEVSASVRHNVMAHADCTVSSWGFNSHGQTTVPQELSGVVAVATGLRHSLALKSDGTVVAWGIDNHGQSTPPEGLDDAIAIAAGYEHSLALRSDGTVVAWGRNLNGESSVPASLSNVIAIAAGVRHSLALQADGTVLGWGLDSSLQSSVPLDVTDAVEIAAGWYHNLARASGESVSGWGRNNERQRLIPDDLTDIVQIKAGRFHSLALKSDGTVVAWGGENLPVSLSADQVADAERAATVPEGLTDVVSIGAGEYHSIAVRADGTVVAWGGNADGQSEDGP